MKYNDIAKQWNNLIDEGQSLYKIINECIDDEGYNSEQELQDLRKMHELFRSLLGDFD